jgi:hypothetical protein
VEEIPHDRAFADMREMPGIYKELSG